MLRKNKMRNDNLKDKSIGIFDSGIGGLTVVKQIIKHLPDEKILYLGDTARVPYGTKSKNTVIKYAESNSHFLLSKGIKLLIVACNTASAYAIESLEEKLSIPVVGVIKPGAKKAAETTKNGNIGVIGTPSTIKSNAYQREIKNIDPEISVYSKPCPLFVPLAEEGWFDNDIAKSVAIKYLSELKDFKIDTLILGCTHYPILKETIGKVMGDDVVLIDSAEQISLKVASIINKNGTVKKESSNISERVYYLTDNSETFISIANRFLGEDIAEIKIVDIV